MDFPCYSFSFLFMSFHDILAQIQKLAVLLLVNIEEALHIPVQLTVFQCHGCLSCQGIHNKLVGIVERKDLHRLHYPYSIMAYPRLFFINQLYDAGYIIIVVFHRYGQNGFGSVTGIVVKAVIVPVLNFISILYASSILK